ncbi:MAG TPA: HAD family phosphatase [Syntrophobacteria bacterium]|nr:HAD family phosphatase [Syntrophobacteria bacterium]
MQQARGITSLFVDIGGVLLTNGWDRQMRKEAAAKFSLDFQEMDERHHLTFDTYEEGKLQLTEYLRRVVFYTDRPFSLEEFEAFMFAQSQPKPEMIDLVRGLKRRYGLKVVAVSNEGRELTVHRVKKFNLGSFMDFFVSSCFVHVRKPDPDIYRIALDIAQTPPEEVLYIDDRAMFVEIAADLGIRGIHHRRYDTTRAALEEMGLSLAQQGCAR